MEKDLIAHEARAVAADLLEADALGEEGGAESVRDWEPAELGHEFWYGDTLPITPADRLRFGQLLKEALGHA